MTKFAPITVITFGLFPLVVIFGWQGFAIAAGVACIATGVAMIAMDVQSR